ncbi:MAG: multidrug transporter [Solibacillus sp.]
MFGSIFYNFWGALGSFTIYFIWALQQPLPLPISVILQSFAAAIVGFILMFAVRYFMSYVMYTPEQPAYNETPTEERTESESSDFDLLMKTKDDSVSEFHDEDSEEIAKVVRTMLHGQTEAPAN